MGEKDSFHYVEIFKYSYDVGLQLEQIVYLENFSIENHQFSIIGIVTRRDCYLSSNSKAQKQDKFEIIITVEAPDDRDKIIEIANILKQSTPDLFEE